MNSTSRSESSPQDIVRPTPQIDDVSHGFWEAARQGTLAIQHCGACDRFQHPPRPLCSACGSQDLLYSPVSGRATLWTWTTTHHTVIDSFADAIPYTCLVVQLEEQADLFLVSDLIGQVNVDVRNLTIGMPMEVAFSPSGREADSANLPQFVPAQ